MPKAPLVAPAPNVGKPDASAAAFGPRAVVDDPAHLPHAPGVPSVFISTAVSVPVLGSDQAMHDDSESE